MSTVAVLLSFGSAVAGLAYDPTLKTSKITLSNSDRTATKDNSSGAGGVTGALGPKSTGKWYVEFVCGAGMAGADRGACGLAPTSFDYATKYLGQTVTSWAYWGGGTRYTNNVTTAGFATYAENDVLGMAWDADAGKLWWAKNNAWQGSGDPGAGTNESYASVTGTLAAHTDCYNADTVFSIRQASGNSYSPPSGFSAWTP